jgi:hypothetical protein
MNGLSATQVETILEKLDDCVDTLEQTHTHNLAANLADLVDEIQQMQRDNSTKASRPDRVGDECWYAEGKTWYKGTLRAWLPGIEYGIATIVIEDEQGNILYPSQISFAKEPPQ